MTKKLFIFLIVFIFNNSLLADTLTLTFVNSVATPAKPGACSGIAWTAGNEFRMCSTSGTALGGGFPLQKDSIFGGEVYVFNSAGILTNVNGTTVNPGSSSGSAAPVTGSNNTWQQDALFFNEIFNFLAPHSGSLAATAYGNATYIGGIPVAGSNIPFISMPVLEAQWGGTWFPLGQVFTGANGIDDSSGVTFTADITNLSANTTTHVISFDFHMYANECIDGSSVGGCTTGGGTEDPGAAGFSGWTAQWHQQGSGSYTDTTAPTLSSTNPTNAATGVATNTASYDVTFNEPMAVGSITSNSIAISGVTVEAPTASNNNKTFSFPISGLVGSTSYTVAFIAAPTDFAGNAMTLPANRSFTTAAGIDSDPPTISSRLPISGATDAIITTTIIVTFNEAMSPATANSITVVKTSDNSLVDGTVTANGANTSFTFNPTSSLKEMTQYTVTVAAATAEDVAGNNLIANDSWSFTTRIGSGTTEPVLESNGQGNGLLAGCSINSGATFDPSLLIILISSFIYLILSRKHKGGFDMK